MGACGKIRNLRGSPRISARRDCIDYQEKEVREMKKYLPHIIFAGLCVVPLMDLSSYIMHILILVLMWSVIGMAWNILGGYTGQISFGHAAFFGFGAYTAGILYQHAEISAWWGLPICIVVL